MFLGSSRSMDSKGNRFFKKCLTKYANSLTRKYYSDEKIPNFQPSYETQKIL